MSKYSLILLFLLTGCAHSKEWELCQKRAEQIAKGYEVPYPEQCQQYDDDDYREGIRRAFRERERFNKQ